MRARRRALPGNFRHESLRQARDAQRLRGRVDGMAGRIAGHSSRFARDGAWDAVRAACGEGTFGGLAARVGLDPASATAREVFLEALSTVGTYAKAWGIVLRFSEGAGHEAFLDAWRMECDVNGLARQIFCDATYFYRGESVTETAGVYDGSVGPPQNYSFVSLTSGPVMGTKFAFDNYVESAETTVVLVIDAHMARKAGALPAVYSLASSVLDLPRSEESVDRTFPLELAHELQAHFRDRWPRGSEASMVAIITVFPLAPGEQRLVTGTGLPTLSHMDIFPRANGAHAHRHAPGQAPDPSP